MAGISKSFGTVKANKNITFSVSYGEIYALLGENGAGKSTLMNILSGVYKPDSGSIYVHGRMTKFSSPSDSIAAGIGMIHQHFKLIGVMNAMENIIAGQEHSFFISRKKLRRIINTVSEKYGFNIDPDKKIDDMSVGEKQTVEILKVLNRGADILILDEPTAVLTPQETRRLFAILNNIKERCAIVIITHKLHEVMEISDKITVLRKGEVAGTVRTDETDHKELTRLMVGRPVNLLIERPPAQGTEEVLRVNGLCVTGESGIPALNNVSFGVRRGEIMGVAGVAGSGQKELCESLQGLQRIKSGTIKFHGKDIAGYSPREIFELGLRISFIPEDRLGMGLVASMNMIDNVMLKDYYRSRGPFPDRKNARLRAEHIVRSFNVHTPGIEHPVSRLSGGNIQKVLLGREIDSNPDFLVTAYPTRGLDIASSHLIYDELNKQKKNGVGILYVGEDLGVLMSLCDRIMVMFEGKINGIVDPRVASVEDIGLLMMGEAPESAWGEQA